MIQQLTQFIHLLIALTEKELKIRYKNATLGFMWAIIYPIIQTIIMTFVFQFFSEKTGKHYVYSLFLNLIIWNFFSQSLTLATTSIVNNRSIIKKSKFPYIAIPLSIVLSNVVHLLVNLVIFLIYLYISKIPVSINFFAILSSFIYILLFTGGLSLITSTLNVKYRDTSFIVQAILMFWFYATPIIYSFKIIPTALQPLWKINPIASVFILIQSGVFKTPTHSFILPSNIAISLFIIIFGVYIFQRKKDSFDDKI